MIKIDLNYALDKNRMNKYKDKMNSIYKMINEKTGLGSEFLGWMNWPINYDKNEYQEMKKVASRWQKEIDYLLVIGIGGSYLGTRAAVDMINGLYPQNQKVKIIYMGNSMSSTYTYQILALLKAKKFGICMISKSGTTTEPSISFRLLRQLLIKQVGVQKAQSLIVCITDKSKGNLIITAKNAKYQTFVMPDDIGGRYSVLTPVGLFPMLVAGINVDNVLAGAKKAYLELSKPNNSAHQYALARYILNTEDKYPVELFVSYEMQMQYFNEWLKQLFGESEGKQGKGLFPASCLFSTDLHSLGQFIQEGTKCLFETVIKFGKVPHDVQIIRDKDDLDQLNYLEKYSLNTINYIAQKGVLNAHKNNGHVPNIILEFAEMSDQMFGYAVYWFFIACATSAYLLEVNPFDQPGVEIYKQNMFKLLGKK